MPRPACPFPPATAVAGYFRDSGGDEQDLSIQRQIGEFTRYCQEHSLVVGEIFRDEARPGSSTIGRVDFLRMIRHFRSGAREGGLIVWRFSRFGRNANDRQFYKAEIRRLGYVIHSLADNIPADRFGKLIEDVLDWKDEYFLHELSEEVASGLRNIVETHGCLPGTPPRGFLREAVTVGFRRSKEPHILHKWTSDPSMRGLVRRAFVMCAQGQTLKQIHLATGLYGSSNSYLTFFRNPLYKGVLHYKDMVIPDYCEAMVEPDLWERVQRLLDVRSRRGHLSDQTTPSLHPRRVASTWLLSGLILCARCGSPMNGHTIHEFDYYACSRAKRRHDCDAPKLPAPRIEAGVLQAVREYIHDPAALIEANSERARLYALATDELPMRLRELETRLANLRRQITNLTNAIAAAGHSDALLRQLTACEVQEYGLKDELEELNKLVASKPTKLTPQRIQRLSEQFDKTFEGGTLEEQRRLLAGWVHEIRAERVERQLLARLEIYVPPVNGPAPPKVKPVLHPETAWGHLLVALQITSAITYLPRGRHVKKDR